MEAKSVIETQEKVDLSLVDSESNPNQGLADIIDRTVTPFGRKEFKNILLNPTSDTTVIGKRQQFTRHLLDHPETRDTLSKHLATIRDHAEFMTLFLEYQESPLHQEILKILFFSSSFFENHYPSVLNTLNESELALTLKHYLPADLVGPILEILIFHFAKEPLQDYFAGESNYSHHDRSAHLSRNDHDKHLHDHDDHRNHDCCPTAPTGAPIGVKLFFNALQALHIGLHAINIHQGISHAMSRHALIAIIHKQLSTTMRCVSAMSAIHSLLTVSDLIDSPNHLEDLTSDLSKLEDPTEDSAFFVNVGEILTGYKKLLASLPQLSNLCEEIGIVDAHLSMAKLIEEHQAKSNRYCFVDFVEHDKPVFIAQALWNPMLTNNSPVTNNINFGKNMSTKLIITSPNKAGKSSLMKTIALNAVLAQSFGLVAADSAALTPFEKIVTYVHLNEDITQDQSMFMAEVLRADYCFKTLQANKEKPALLLVDDSLFKSTNSMKGEQLAYDFIKTFKDFDHALILIATHFPLLTTLEDQTNRAFTNYHIHLTRDAQHHLHSTYKLEEGSDIEHDSFALINGTTVMQGLCCN